MFVSMEVDWPVYDVYLTGTLIKRGNNRPYAWVERHVILCNTVLLYFTRGYLTQPRGYKILSTSSTACCPKRFHGYPNCVLVFDVPEGITLPSTADIDEENGDSLHSTGHSCAPSHAPSLTSSHHSGEEDDQDLRIIDAFRRAESPKFAFFAPSQREASRWRKALMRGCILARLLKEGKLIEERHHHAAMRVAEDAVQAHSIQVLLLTSQLRQLRASGHHTPRSPDTFTTPPALPRRSATPAPPRDTAGLDQGHGDRRSPARSAGHAHTRQGTAENERPAIVELTLPPLALNAISPRTEIRGAAAGEKRAAEDQQSLEQDTHANREGSKTDQREATAAAKKSPNLSADNNETFSGGSVPSIGASIHRPATQHHHHGTGSSPRESCEPAENDVPTADGGRVDADNDNALPSCPSSVDGASETVHVPSEDGDDHQREPNGCNGEGVDGVVGSGRPGSSSASDDDGSGGNRANPSSDTECPVTPVLTEAHPHRNNYPLLLSSPPHPQPALSSPRCDPSLPADALQMRNERRPPPFHPNVLWPPSMPPPFPPLLHELGVASGSFSPAFFCSVPVPLNVCGLSDAAIMAFLWDVTPWVGGEVPAVELRSRERGVGVVLEDVRTVARLAVSV